MTSPGAAQVRRVWCRHRNSRNLPLPTGAHRRMTLFAFEMSGPRHFLPRQLLSARRNRRVLVCVLGESEIAKRQLIEPKPGDKRYVRRDDKGHFTDQQDDVGRSLTQERRKDAKHEASRGQGDRGDRKTASK